MVKLPTIHYKINNTLHPRLEAIYIKSRPIVIDIKNKAKSSKHSKNQHGQTPYR